MYIRNGRVAGSVYKAGLAAAEAKPKAARRTAKKATKKTEPAKSEETGNDHDAVPEGSSAPATGERDARNE